jgi:hypothetical protein
MRRVLLTLRDLLFLPALSFVRPCRRRFLIRRCGTDWGWLLPHLQALLWIVSVLDADETTEPAALTTAMYVCTRLRVLFSNPPTQRAASSYCAQPNGERRRQ